MIAAFHQIVYWIARATEQELASQVEYLKAENEMLRNRLGKRVVLTDEERGRLVRLGRQCGAAIRGLITVVTYSTFRRWVRDAEEAEGKDVTKRPARKEGRPRTADAIRELILMLARENAWGYTRILG